MSVTALRRKAPELKRRLEIVKLTPERAMELLEHNRLNRPLNQAHVNRIIGQIKEGKWQFNGDTIKIANDGNVVDGQHRLWAVSESKIAVETVVIYGVAREAFSTIDTISKPRGPADILALNGVDKYRSATGMALGWLIKWQRGIFHGPNSRVENSEIEDAFAHHPSMVQAVERANHVVHGWASPGLIGFLYYIFASRDEELADRFLSTLESPAGVSASDPFFRFRNYLTTNSRARREPVVTIALAIKAANAAHANKKIEVLNWRNQGEHPEPFPKIQFGLL